MIAFSNSYQGSAPGGLAELAAAHYAQEFSYFSQPVPPESNPDRTANHLKTLRQAILGEGELDLLSKGMKDFATTAPYAPLRKELARRFGAGSVFHFLRAGDNEGEFLYRGENGTQTTFWTLRTKGGLLYSLNWEDE